MRWSRLTKHGGAASLDGVSLHRALRYVEDHPSGHVDAPEGPVSSGLGADHLKVGFPTAFEGECAVVPVKPYRPPEQLAPIVQRSIAVSER